MANDKVIKNGKKPLSTKAKPQIQYDDLFGNKYKLPKELEKELREQGLEWRFIEAKRYYENGGQHDKGWVAYKPKNNPSATMNLQSFSMGRDPEGYYRRGSDILAVKTTDQAEMHRAFLKQRAQQYKSFNRDQANELRKMARDSQVDSEIHEGYEENED